MGEPTLNYTGTAGPIPYYPPNRSNQYSSPAVPVATFNTTPNTNSIPTHTRDLSVGMSGVEFSNMVTAMNMGTPWPEVVGNEPNRGLGMGSIDR